MRNYMASIQVTQTDIARLKVIMSAMRKGKWELEGDEVLAFAQGFAWTSDMNDRINAALNPVNKIDPVKTEPVKKVKK
jgi:hypothetical protein